MFKNEYSNVWVELKEWRVLIGVVRSLLIGRSMSLWGFLLSDSHRSFEISFDCFVLAQFIEFSLFMELLDLNIALECSDSSLDILESILIECAIFLLHSRDLGVQTLQLFLFFIDFRNIVLQQALYFRWSFLLRRHKSSPFIIRFEFIVRRRHHWTILNGFRILKHPLLQFLVLITFRTRLSLHLQSIQYFFIDRSKPIKTIGSMKSVYHRRECMINKSKYVTRIEILWFESGFSNHAISWVL